MHIHVHLLNAFVSRSPNMYVTITDLLMSTSDANQQDDDAHALSREQLQQLRQAYSMDELPRVTRLNDQEVQSVDSALLTADEQVGQSGRRSVGWLVGWLVGQQAHRLASRSVSRLVDQSVGRSSGWSVGQAAAWSVSRSAGRSIGRLPDRPAGRLLVK